MQRAKLLSFAFYGLVVFAVLAAVIVGFRKSLWASTQRLSAQRPFTQKNLPAFPGAEGFGSVTTGGRFGRIVFVTNLNDTTDVTSNEYRGSFRWALDHEWADNPALLYDQRRFIIFKVGGTINLQEPLVVSRPYTTIAGQSAPGGITLRREGLIISTHDVIVRGLRIRVGDEAGPSCCRDGVNVSTSNSSSDIYNVIVDHTSISWAIDENFSFYIEPDSPYSLHDVTVQWTIISEGLHRSVHIDEGKNIPDSHSMGMIIGEGTVNVSIHHNLFAHNWGRNPRLSGVDNVEFLNNVIYGWDDKAVEINNMNIAHVISNYFKLGSHSEPFEIVLSALNPASVLFLDGNIADDGKNIFAARISGDDQKTASGGYDATNSGILASDAFVAYSQVLESAGAWTPGRDSVDMRVVSDVRGRTGSIIDSPLQVGGWPIDPVVSYPIDGDNDGIPSDWESAHGLNPAFAGDANNPDMLSPDGYSWIEEYVNSLIP